VTGADERRWALVGVLAATLVVVLDWGFGPKYVFVTAVAVGPALAAVAARPLVTALVGAYALVVAVLAGSFVEDLTTGDQLVRYAAIAAVSAAVTLTAARRDDRERKLIEVTKVAEVAQRTILRSLPATLGPVAFGARYLSATHDALIGGDFYDAVQTAHGVRAVVGDVRGKGLEAVQLASDVLGSFRGAAHLNGMDDVVRTVDEAVQRVVAEEDFVTAVFVQFNDDGTLCLVNCGHPAPLLLGTDTARFIEGGRTRPLGLEPEADVHIEPFVSGDRLLLYTDGLIEARDRDGAYFPLERWSAALRQPTLDRSLDVLLDELVAHAGEVTDDVAVLLTEAR
jgi:serine phosphatase RsbU (regulator of sigma subunit)